MKVIVWAINYAPELTGIGPCNTALCNYLKKAGHEVEVVTSFPYYPSWRKRPEDCGRHWRTNTIDAIKVHRCWHYVPPNVTRLKRIFHEASFALTSFVRVIALRRPNLIVAVSPPLLLGPAAWLASKLLRTRYVFHVQDLQPDAALHLGMLKPSVFTRFLYAIEAFSYRGAWRVSGISRGMLAAISAKGVSQAKLVYFPNGVEVSQSQNAPQAFRQRHGFSNEDFLAVYSGNIGVKQGLETLVDSAKFLCDERIRIIIFGDGSQRRAIESRAANRKNVIMLPLLSAEDYQAMLHDCDIALITQAAGSASIFFPSKLLASFAAAKPVLSISDPESELARAIHESGGGENIAPGQPEALARTLEKLRGDGDLRTKMSGAGRAWVEQFEIGRVHQAFVTELAKEYEC